MRASFRCLSLSLLLVVVPGCTAWRSAPAPAPELEPRVTDDARDPQPRTPTAPERAPAKRPTADAAPAEAPRERTVREPVTVIKSPNDPRAYRFLTLDNGLRVLLASDPETDKAAASLVVFRGSYHEPDAYPGLAHFLEHMLFIGTRKYPEVDAYQRFVAQHGGSSNAYTAGDHTNYFFDIQPAYFEAAMDRFAQFFISPLFADAYVNREKNAVHSEYQMQLKADAWRASAVVAEVVNPEHPESRFSIGRLDTLDAGVRDALLAFFETHYSADQMVLVAVSDQPLAEMAEWIAPMFGAIENRELGPAPVTEPLLRASALPAVLTYQTIKQGYKATYNFPVPATDPFYRQKPAHYLSNLLGHEGRGSLFEQLRQRGWIESLSAGASDIDDRNGLLVVDMALTDAGYAHLEQITDLLFDYIELLRQSPPEQWRYREQARVAKLGFRFQEQSSATSFVYQVAPRFQDYPPGDVLVAPYLMTDFEPALIERYLSRLRPDNLLLEVAGPDVETDRRERWFDVPYRLERRPVERADAGATALALPAPNPFLPDDLTVRPHDPEPPVLAVARPGLTLWSDRDTSFGTPRANLFLSLGIPQGIASPADQAFATLYERLVEDALGSELYPAYLAGLGYDLDVNSSGFTLTIGGYSDKQLALLDTVLVRLGGLTIDPDRFATLKRELLRDWRNHRNERPYTQAFGAISYLLMSSRWPPELLIEALSEAEPDDLRRWRAQRASRFHVLGLRHGNLPVQAAWALASTLQQRLPLGAFRREPPAVADLDAALRYGLDIDHQDAAMVLYLQDANATVAARAQSALATSLLRQAYFSSLRTDQQLGYVVSVSNPTLWDQGGLAFIVQSPVASSTQLVRATRTFLQEQQQAIAQMSDEAFAQYQAGLISELLERDRNLRERGSRLWHNLELGVTSFDLDQQIATAVAALQKTDMVAFVDGLIDRFDRERLLVYSRGGFDEAPEQGAELQDVRAFKAAR